ncbi:hypothetical protein NOK91_25580 [Vibrio parahaemolyticus]|uniref:hypothetical protein n=1 Tax=Vibrio parahaemolyticus TaxID=670 RepID=UPI00226B489B|nr:hypothetical protein [Vibrio parahaemolyticus]MCX8890511.1 hypothetical protein [Vibrio parahaemolyticus]
MNEEIKNELPKHMNFDSSIDALEARGRRARRTMLMIGTALLCVVQILVVLIFYQYQDRDVSFAFSSRSLSATLEARGAQLADSLLSLEKNIVSNEIAETKLKETITLINDLKSSESSSQTPSSGFASSLSTIAFSFGAVGFVILLIQIAVQFMRYYARLAELYHAQADALRASGGDPIVAFKFIEHFSPSSIDIGKAPTSVYEKALDTISTVAKK